MKIIKACTKSYGWQAGRLADEIEAESKKIQSLIAMGKNIRFSALFSQSTTLFQ